MRLVLLVTVFAEIALAQDDRLDRELGVEGGLHARDVVQAVQSTSHDRAARAAELQAARADIDRALFALVPRLELSASYTRLSEISAPTLGYVAAPADQTQGGPIAPGTPLVAIPLRFPVLLDQTMFRAQLVIPVSDYFLRVMPSRDAAEHAVNASGEQLDVSDQRLALEAETLYWSWARTRLSTIVARQALERATAHRDDARRVRDAGAGVEADVSRAEAQVAEMQALVDTTEHLHSAIADRLRTVMHVDSIADAIGDDLIVDDGPIDLQASVDRALERRSELHAIDEQIAVLQSQRTASDAAYLPRLDVIGEVMLADPNPRFVPQREQFDATWAVGARVSWQLADALGAEPAHRAIDARIAAVREQRELLGEAIRAEVVDAHRSIADAHSSMAAREPQIEAATRTLQQASDLFRAGRGTGLPVIDAQTLLVRAQLDLLSARIDFAIASARLRRAIEAQ